MRLAPLALALVLLPRAAHARCAVQQAQTSDGVDVVVEAQAEPIGCRTVTVTGDAPVELRAFHLTPGGRRDRVRKEHLRRLPGGGWEVSAPGLREGDRLLLQATFDGKDLTVALAPASDVVPPPPPGVRFDERRDVLLEPRHPAWGFADPSRARTDTELRIDGPLPEGWLIPLPADAEVVDAGGLLPVPLGLRAPPGATGVRTVRWRAPGAAPQGVVQLPAGSLVLASPGVEWVATAGPGVAVSPVDGGVRFDAPAGGEARWRVARVAGEGVIPDAATFQEGLDWRFAQVSLPEPAVPVRIRRGRDRGALLRDLWLEVRSLGDGALPGADPLRPRQLNRAWRSGWVTPVERALILHRFLGQEKFDAGWVLTGAAADPVTLTGFDTLLVPIVDQGDLVWLDPGCVACAFGEVRTSVMGRAAVGSADAVPRFDGRLERRLSLTDTRFTATITATGAAALWLREQVVGVDPERRAERLAAAVGMRGGTLTAATGVAEPGADITLAIESGRFPTAPFDGEPPWVGGWADVLPMDPAPATD